MESRYNGRFNPNMMGATAGFSSVKLIVCIDVYFTAKLTISTKPIQKLADYD